MFKEKQFTVGRVEMIVSIFYFLFGWYGQLYLLNQAVGKRRSWHTDVKTGILGLVTSNCTTAVLAD